MFKVMKENNQNALAIILVVFNDNYASEINFWVTKKAIIGQPHDYSSLKKYFNSFNSIYFRGSLHSAWNKKFKIIYIDSKKLIKL